MHSSRHCRWRSKKFRDALPLVPGVIRSLDGKLTVRGTSENQGSWRWILRRRLIRHWSSQSPYRSTPFRRLTLTNALQRENGVFPEADKNRTTRAERLVLQVKAFNVSLRGKNGRFVASHKRRLGSFGGPVIGGK